MATLPLTPPQIDTVVQTATIAMLGLPVPQSTTDPVYERVRIGWQQQGQPFETIDEDIITLRCVEVDDLYNRVRDVSYVQNNFVKLTQYTRVWQVFWVVYGPNSFDNCRRLRSRLFDQDIHDIFSSSLLYLVTDPAAPTRVPEEHDGQWWERVDFWAKFNEFVTEEYGSQAVLSAEVIVIDSKAGEIADITVSNLPTALVPACAMSTSGGMITLDEAALILQQQGNQINFVQVGAQTYSGDLGTCAITTGELVAGDFQHGCTLADGGRLLVTMPGAPNIQYAATLQGTVWALVTTLDGSNSYTLTANLVSGQGNGTFTLETVSIGSGLWSVAAAVQGMSLNLV
jgi:hypothetical protein